jgi:hypothetical protein
VDIDREDMEQEELSSALNLFSQLDSKGKVGSVHSSSVHLKARESVIPVEDAAGLDRHRLPMTKRAVSSCRLQMETCGGQGCLPIMKSNTLTDQRQNVEKLTALPLLMHRLLASPAGSFDQDKSKVTKEVISKFETLDSMLGTIRSEVANTGKNTVRLECFVTSTLRNKSCDMTLPVLDPWDSMWTVNHDVFKEHWSKRLLVCQRPLKNFVQDLKELEKANRKLLVQKMSPGVRTTLVFCTEKCVEAANILGFRGRVIQLIWGELSHNNCKRDQFVLPATCLEAHPPSRLVLCKPPIVRPTVQETEDDGEVLVLVWVVGGVTACHHVPDSFFCSLFRCKHNIKWHRQRGETHI